jgi:hypothetical protein
MCVCRHVCVVHVCVVAVICVCVCACVCVCMCVTRLFLGLDGVGKTDLEQSQDLEKIPEELLAATAYAPDGYVCLCVCLCE